MYLAPDGTSAEYGSILVEINKRIKRDLALSANLTSLYAMTQDKVGRGALEEGVRVTGGGAASVPPRAVSGRFLVSGCSDASALSRGRGPDHGDVGQAPSTEGSRGAQGGWAPCSPGRPMIPGTSSRGAVQSRCPWTPGLPLAAGF